MTDPDNTPVRVRRAPKLGVFLIIGGGLGAIAAIVLSLAFPDQGDYPLIQVVGFMLVIGIVVGVTVGGVIALILDRRATRRARVVEAHRIRGS